MKIQVDKLGPLGHAAFELGDMTIICGRNNTGKTYATYATYGFLDFLRSEFNFSVSRQQIHSLMSEGAVSIDLTIYSDATKLQKQIDRAAKKFTSILGQIFAGNDKLFEDSQFSFFLNLNVKHKQLALKKEIGSAEKTILKIVKKKDSDKLLVTLMVNKTSDDVPPRHFVETVLGDTIREIILNAVIPRPFIASAERTGSAIFQKELDFTRNRLVDLLGDKTENLHPIKLFIGKFSGEYPIPVKRNVDFIRSLPNIVHKESFINKEHPEILSEFQDIIGGEYRVTKDGEIRYIPNTNKRIKLALVESSSAVRSLLDIGFYLRHVARHGDMLMVDEPELNLHPENQRRVARLFARLVNLGIRVFITTHSDYLIKELNTLIMLNHDKKHLKQIMKNEGYNKEELLKAGQVRVYIAEEKLLKKPGNKKRSRCLTLVPADIDPELGIEARSFDTTIDEMNRIQESILFSGEDE